MLHQKQPLSKWRFAIGTTSRVPNSGGALHYLIADFDDEIPDIPVEVVAGNHLIIQRTPHGWHLYSDQCMPFDHLIKVLEHIGADTAWIEIGKERGYYFLADKQKIEFPWPVEHMVIYYGEEETRPCNPGSSGQILRAENNHKGDV
jgi:hypothetical protein